jgi:hypothetical protein
MTNNEIHRLRNFLVKHKTEQVTIRFYFYLDKGVEIPEMLVLLNRKLKTNLHGYSYCAWTVTNQITTPSTKLQEALSDFFLRNFVQKVEVDIYSFNNRCLAAYKF